MIRSVCVAGAGAIGSLFAGTSRRVADVSVLTRREEHARALNAHGLRVSGRSDFTVRPGRGDRSRTTCRSRSSSSSPARAPTSSRSPRALAGHFAGATVMTVQNGLGAEEIVGRSRRLAAALRGHVHERDAPRRRRTSSTCSTPRPGSGRTAARPPTTREAVAELIVSSGLKAEAFADLRPAQWSKLIFNATVNAVAALDRASARLPLRETEGVDLGAPRARPRRRGQGGRRRRRRRAARGSLGDERARDAARARALPLDARGRRRRAGRPRSSSSPARSCARPSGAASPSRCTPRMYRLVRGKGGRLLVRICIVGCGAVGSLFAANLAQLDDVEVWAYDA